jgi:hypothetical protein
MSAKDTPSYSDLADLPRADLVNLWQVTLRKAPPKGASRKLLAHAIAYAQQERQEGGLSRRQKRLLLAIAETGDLQALTQDSRTNSAALKPGTRLVREWHGNTHIVEVLRDGFLWNDRLYPSLTAIAKAITGTHWSGPRFFGL